ncbi:TPA: hypothetical protein ACXE5H_000716 [Enterobacter chengduensis]
MLFLLQKVLFVDELSTEIYLFSCFNDYLKGKIWATREALQTKSIWEGGYPLNSQEDSQSYTEWTGYHGTSLSSAEEIVVNNYRISEQDRDWLGNGAYFFIAGYTDPIDSAVDWARYRSWDPEARKRKYSRYAVLRSLIRTQSHLDLDEVEDLLIFNTIRDKLAERMQREGYRNAQALENDCYVANFALDNLKLDALVRREAITSRRGQLRTRIPNCRIMCLKEPTRCAIKHDIVTKGSI